MMKSSNELQSTFISPTKKHRLCAVKNTEFFRLFFPAESNKCSTVETYDGEVLTVKWDKAGKHNNNLQQKINQESPSIDWTSDLTYSKGSEK